MTTAILLVTVLPWPGAKLNSNSNKKIVYCFLFTLLVMHTFSLQVQCHTQVIHTCQATTNISRSPIENQWGSLKYPGQPNTHDHGHIQGIKVLIQYTHKSDACTIEFPVLTYWGLVTHVCADELGLHWLRQWLVALLVPSHHLYQGRHLPTKWSCSGLNVLTIKSHGDFIQINWYPAW